MTAFVGSANVASAQGLLDVLFGGFRSNPAYVPSHANSYADPFGMIGTGVPIPSPDRFGPSTLVEAGDQKLLIDAGRGAAGVKACQACHNFEKGAAAKVGRNDPCPCGSGKKYKKCHGA